MAASTISKRTVAQTMVMGSRASRRPTVCQKLRERGREVVRLRDEVAALQDRGQRLRLDGGDGGVIEGVEAGAQRGRKGKVGERGGRGHRP